jgi:hypothetical protein
MYYRYNSLHAKQTVIEMIVAIKVNSLKFITYGSTNISIVPTKTAEMLKERNMMNSIFEHFL